MCVMSFYTNPPIIADFFLLLYICQYINTRRPVREFTARLKMNSIL